MTAIPIILSLLFAIYLVRAKPGFFWNHYRVKEARQTLGDKAAEQVCYGAIAFIGVVLLAAAWWDG